MKADKVYHRSVKNSSSSRDDWGTPNCFVDWLNEHILPIDFDLAANEDNAVVEKYTEDFFNYTPQSYTNYYLNPPFSQAEDFLERIVQKYAGRKSGKTAVLLPVRTGSAWWVDYVAEFAAEIIFLQGRIKFVGADSCAPFDTAIAMYYSSYEPCEHSYRYVAPDDRLRD